jgi:hypothetical protein
MQYEFMAFDSDAYGGSIILSEDSVTCVDGIWIGE